MFLNEITIGESQEPTAGEADFTITIGKVQINLTSPGLNEKRLWVKNVTEAKRKNQQFEQQQLQRQRSSKTCLYLVGSYLVVEFKHHKTILKISLKIFMHFLS